MAVDTAQKRFSILNVGSPFRLLKIIPTGVVNAAERRVFIFHYPGFAIDDQEEEDDKLRRGSDWYCVSYYHHAAPQITGNPVPPISTRIAAPVHTV